MRARSIGRSMFVGAVLAVVPCACGAPMDPGAGGDTNDATRVDPVARSLLYQSWQNTQSDLLGSCDDPSRGCAGTGHIRSFAYFAPTHSFAIEIFESTPSLGGALPTRFANAVVTGVTRTGQCTPVPPAGGRASGQVTGDLTLQIRTDGQGGANYPYSYTYAFDCASGQLTLTPDHQDHAVDPDALSTANTDSCRADGDACSPYQSCCRGYVCYGDGTCHADGNSPPSCQALGARCTATSDCCAGTACLESDQTCHATR